MDVPQLQIKKILYTTDLSETGRHAFTYAASLAHQYKANLTVFHAVDEGPELSWSLAGYMDEKLWEEIKERDLHEAKAILTARKRDNTMIKESIDEYCEDIQAANTEAYVAYNIQVTLGHPVEQIIGYATTGAYDLIVMGNIGHSPLKNKMMGSTVQSVLRRSPIPVLVVRIPI